MLFSIPASFGQYFSLPGQSREYLSFQNPANVSPEKWRYQPLRDSLKWNFSKLSIAQFYSPLEESNDRNQSSFLSFTTHRTLTQNIGPQLLLGANLFSDQAGRLRTFMGGLKLGVLIPTGSYKNSHYSGISVGLGYNYTSINISDPSTLLLYDKRIDPAIAGFNSTIMEQVTGGVFFYDRIRKKGPDYNYYAGISVGGQFSGKNNTVRLQTVRYLQFSIGMYIYLAKSNFFEPYMFFEKREGVRSFMDSGFRYHFALAGNDNIYFGSGLQNTSSSYQIDYADRMFHLEVGFARVLKNRQVWQLGIGYIPRNTSHLIQTIELNASISWR